jgi:hypothetical protein
VDAGKAACWQSDRLRYAPISCPRHMPFMTVLTACARSCLMLRHSIIACILEGVTSTSAWNKLSNKSPSPMFARMGIPSSKYGSWGSRSWQMTSSVACFHFPNCLIWLTRDVLYFDFCVNECNFIFDCRGQHKAFSRSIYPPLRLSLRCDLPHHKKYLTMIFLNLASSYLSDKVTLPFE